MPCRVHFGRLPILTWTRDRFFAKFPWESVIDYLVVRAPRQTGKTTVLLALQDLLATEGDYRCVYVNVEGGQAMREDVRAAMEVILSQMALHARVGAGDEYLTRSWPKIFAEHGPAALGEALSRWTQADAMPLVLLIDEIDALVGDTLLAVLRQLRAGYHMRSKGFPQSAILCGVRDVRDYRIHSSSANTLVSGGSAFNIKSESLRLGDFTPDEVRTLLGQHTAETGQPFTEDARDAVWTQTQGQPWLVNALAYEACFRGASACASTWSSARFGTTAEAWNAPWPTGSSRRHGTWTDAEPRRATWSPTAARNGPGTRRCSATAGPPRVAWRLRFGGCSDGGGRDRGPCGRYRGLTSITITRTKRRWSGDSCSWSRSSSLSGDFGRVPACGTVHSPNQKTR